jgi:hypothetical protein
MLEEAKRMLFDAGLRAFDSNCGKVEHAERAAPLMPEAADDPEDAGKMEIGVHAKIAARCSKGSSAEPSFAAGPPGCSFLLTDYILATKKWIGISASHWPAAIAGHSARVLSF